MGIREKLVGAMRRQELIRILYRTDQTDFDGYVLDVGPGFLVLANVSEKIRFNGFTCMRIANVGRIDRHPYAEFVQAALGLRGQTLPSAPSICLRTVEEMLRTAGAAFPLVTLHYDDSDPHVCWIGQVRDVNSVRVELLEIKPGADWYDETQRHKLQGITRVDFDGGYENALWLVGGKSAPQPNRKP
jgi:hypothetical protein